MPDYPNWLLQLIAAVEHYEDCHGHPDDSWTCLHSSLLPVPTEVRSMARGYTQAKRETTDAQ